MMNIPIFRAKKIDRNEYIVGHYIEDENRQCIVILEKMFKGEPIYTTVDKSTLSIHFPDMLDSEGNKIFASLSEDGKGGDICESTYFTRVAIYKQCLMYLKNGHIIFGGSSVTVKIIGIQQ